MEGRFLVFETDVLLKTKARQKPGFLVAGAGLEPATFGL